jgi:hypothetical protein
MIWGVKMFPVYEVKRGEVRRGMNRRGARLRRQRQVSRTAERCDEGLRDSADILQPYVKKSRPQLQGVGTGEREQLLLAKAMRQGSVGMFPRESIVGV